MLEVGNKVRVKSLATLLSEFKVGICGDIQCFISFDVGMRRYCDKEYRIRQRNELQSGSIVYQLEGLNDEDGGVENWAFSSDMFYDMGCQ